MTTVIEEFVGKILPELGTTSDEHTVPVHPDAADGGGIKTRISIVSEIEAAELELALMRWEDDGGYCVPRWSVPSYPVA